MMQEVRGAAIIGPAVSLTLLLAACGSGGGDGGGAADNRTGVFMNGSVAGLRYETPSHSGLVGTGGEFSYNRGETVSFHLGGIDLGSAPAADWLDLFDLQGLEPPVSELDVRVELANRDLVSGFDRVANIAMLLATLDNDRQLGNGIDVSGWDQQLADFQLDFDINLYAFPTSLGARSLTALKTAFAVNYRLPVTVPLTFVYENLDLSVPARLPVTRWTDTGMADDINSITAMEYDQLGREITVCYDVDADGTFEITTETGYDDLHRPVASDSRSATTASTRTRVFDGGGNLQSVLSEEDTGMDGVPDEITRSDYSYDNGGNRLEFVYERDEDADGAIDGWRTEVRSFDGMGNLLSQTFEEDDNNDGDIDRRVTRSSQYDGEGRLLKMVEQADGDATGPVDGDIEYQLTRRITYDGAGRRVSERREADSGVDGSIDSIGNEEYEYDGSGNLIRRVVEPDNDADGSPETRTTFDYQYNDGREVKSVLRREDLSPSGANLTSKTVTDYSYSEAGLLRERVTARSDGDGNLQSRTTNTYTHGPDGYLLGESSTREGEYNGPILSDYSMTYDYETRENGLLFLIDHYDYSTLSTGIGFTAFGDTAIVAPSHND